MQTQRDGNFTSLPAVAELDQLGGGGGESGSDELPHCRALLRENEEEKERHENVNYPQLLTP